MPGFDCFCPGSRYACVDDGCVCVCVCVCVYVCVCVCVSALQAMKNYRIFGFADYFVTAKVFRRNFSAHVTSPVGRPVAIC